jgi:protein-tyrosine kinase
MDYIQKAIDRAREERQGNAAPQAEASSSSTTPDVAIAKTAMPDAINYTRTRQIELNPSWLKNQRIIAGLNNDSRAEVYRQLRTQVLQKLRANSWKTIAVTSPNENAGKSVTSINLAIAISKEVNQTVLLVDLDLRNPSIAKKIGVNVEQGLIDHLKSGVSIASLLINPNLERLVILPGRDDAEYSSEILTMPAMKALMSDLTSRYESRIIIFDMPALLVNDDAMMFLPEADAVLLVVENGGTTQEELERAKQLLEGCNLLGTVLNKLD